MIGSMSSKPLANKTKIHGGGLSGPTTRKQNIRPKTITKLSTVAA
jgi:hypothetical protein